MSNDEFAELKNNVGGLIAFNSFLSTSAAQDVSLVFAAAVSGDPDMTAILYVIHVDLALISTPIAYLDEHFSHFRDEQEYLWGMNAVFRIAQIREMHNRPCEVVLKMTSSNDVQLKQLTDHLRKEVGLSSGLQRLGNLMIEMGEWDKAKDIYETILREQESPYIMHQLGFIAHRMNDFNTALMHYRQVLSILVASPSPNGSELAVLYSNIGCVLKDQDRLKEALEQFKLALKLKRINDKSDKLNTVSHLFGVNTT